MSSRSMLALLLLASLILAPLAWEESFVIGSDSTTFVNYTTDSPVTDASNPQIGGASSPGRLDGCTLLEINRSMLTPDSQWVLTLEEITSIYPDPTSNRSTPSLTLRLSDPSGQPADSEQVIAYLSNHSLSLCPAPASLPSQTARSLWVRIDSIDPACAATRPAQDPHLDYLLNSQVAQSPLADSPLAMNTYVSFVRTASTPVRSQVSDPLTNRSWDLALGQTLKVSDGSDAGTTYLQLDCAASPAGAAASPTLRVLQVLPPSDSTMVSARALTIEPTNPAAKSPSAPDSAPASGSAPATGSAQPTATPTSAPDHSETAISSIPYPGASQSASSNAAADSAPTASDDSTLSSAPKATPSSVWPWWMAPALVGALGAFFMGVMVFYYRPTILNPFPAPQAPQPPIYLSDSRLSLLRELEGSERIPTDIALRLKKGKSTVVEQLEELGRLGLVERVAQPGKKFVFYRLTRAGRQALLQHAQGIRDPSPPLSM